MNTSIVFGQVYTLKLHKFLIVGWAVPTKNRSIHLATVGRVHSTPILQESTAGKLQSWGFNTWILHELEAFMCKMRTLIFKVKCMIPHNGGNELPRSRAAKYQNEFLSYLTPMQSIEEFF